jgi:flagellar hook-length control protein FliK
MPSLTLPAANPTLPGLTAAPSSARGRAAAADDARGQGFGHTLDRVRKAASSKAGDATEPAVADGAAPHKLARAGGKKSELSAADVMALLAPAAPPVALAPAPVVQSPAAPSATGSTGAAGTPIDSVLAQAAQAEQGVKDASAQAAAAASAARAAADGTADALPDADPLAKADAPTPPAATQEAAKAAKSDSPLDASLRAELAKAMPLSDAIKAKTSAPTPSPSAPAQATAAAPLSPNAGKPTTSTTASAAASATASAANAAASTNAAKPDASAPLAAAGAKLAATSGPSADDAAKSDTAAGPQALPQLQALVPTSVERLPVTTNATPLLTVAPPVGSSEWGTAIGQQMIRMTASGQHVAELSLNPAGLGPLKVTLSLGDNQAQAMFVSAHESVRKAVEAALPQLRSTLADQGISLGQASVGAETRQPGQGSAFGQQPQQQRAPGQPDYPGIARRDLAGAADAIAALRPGAAAASNAGLDTFA